MSILFSNQWIFKLKKLLLLLSFVFSIGLGIGCCSHQSYAVYPSSQKDFISHINNSTVALVVSDDDGDYFSYCAGFWVSETHIITARHCVSDDFGNVKFGSIIRYTVYKDFTEKQSDYKPKHVYSAIIVAEKDTKDLAVLKSTDNVSHSIPKIARGPVRSGTHANILGHPSGLKWSFMSGDVSGTRQMKLDFFGLDLKLLHITSLIWRGNSGGPAFNDDGDIIGIASFIRMDVPGMSFFVHKDELITLLDNNDIKYY